MYDDHRIIFEPSAEAQTWIDVAKRADWHNKQATDEYNHNQTIKRMKAKVKKFKSVRLNSMGGL